MWNNPGFRKCLRILAVFRSSQYPENKKHLKAREGRSRNKKRQNTRWMLTPVLSICTWVRILDGSHLAFLFHICLFNFVEKKANGSTHPKWWVDNKQRPHKLLGDCKIYPVNARHGFVMEIYLYGAYNNDSERISVNQLTCTLKSIIQAVGCVS